MYFNGEEIKIKNIDATIFTKNKVGFRIYIFGEDEKEIEFCSNNEEIDPRTFNVNEKVNIIKNIYWDISLKTDESYYLFDITKDSVYLTRLEDDKYRLEVNVVNPDMIYTPLGENVSFDSLVIDTTFTFDVE